MQMTKYVVTVVYTYQRKENSEKYSLAEIGRRAIMIHDLNALRNQLKNKIAEILDDNIKDIKFI